MSMSGNEIRAPIPLKNRTLSQLKLQDMKSTRSSSSMADDGSKRPKLHSPEGNQGWRPRSATPNVNSPRLLNGMDSKKIFNDMQKYYGLDYVDDRDEHLNQIHDPKSQWFSRAIRQQYLIEDTLPYKTESHKDQAKYLCHVLINLYIAIRSLDIQGLISISSKDLADLKGEVDNLALNTDLFRLTSDAVDAEVLNNDIADFDEDEDEDDMFDDNEYIDLIGPDFNATGKITAKSASIINVNHWTNEFKNCMHFDFPLSLRKSLAIVYYYLSLVQGQKVYRQMHVEMFELLVANDDDGTNFTDLLYESGLRLDHTIIFRFLSDFLPYPEPDYVRYDLSIKEDLQLFRLLLKLANNSKAFFEDKSATMLIDTMGYLLSSLAPSTIPIIMPMITSLVPFQYHQDGRITDYFPFCFGFWTCKTADASVDTHMYDFMGSVAEDAHWKLIKNVSSNPLVEYGDYLLFTDDQMSFMFNRLQVHLRADGQIHSYSRTVRPLVYSLNGCCSGPFFDRLVSLTKSIETFVHPSNTGFWTKPISKFVHGFIKMYHGRVQKEKKQRELGIHHPIYLDSKCHSKMVDIFLNLLISGAQNKSPDVANYYISCLAYLLDLQPDNFHIVFDRILIDVYEALAGEHVNSTHRLVASLKQFNRVVRFMVMDKLYRVHVTNVLLMFVDKIDMNDINLTSNLINGIVSIASFIPFQNFVGPDEYLTFESHTLPCIQQHYYYMKDSNDEDKFIYDEELLEIAFKASTTVFEDVLRIYTDKLFQLVDVDLEDGFVTKVNQTTMIMQESMDDATFGIFSQLLQKRFWDNDSFKEKDPQYDLVIIPLAALTRRNKALAQPLFDDLTYHVKEQIERGAGSIRASTEIQQRDVKLVLYLTAVNEVLRQSHNAIFRFSEKLEEFMKYVFESITNPPLDVITSIMIHSACASLTSTEIIDYRLFPEQSKIPWNERWGGLQFDARKYDKENLDFTWHVPTGAEITLAIDFLKSTMNYCITNVENMMANPHNDFTYSDKIQKYILIITHALSGSSLLFDPDFNKNNSQQVTELQSCKEKFMLLKNIRENNFDNQEMDIDIEQIRSEKGGEEYIDEKNPSDSQTPGNEGVVEMKETAADDVFIDDEAEMSEVPSGIATPEPGAHLSGDFNSSMNSRLAFRDLDIYTCNYFFGNTLMEKVKHPQYLEVHCLRATIGRFLHKLYKFLMEHFENNTSMFQILLHGMKVWFTDVGQETVFIEDPCAFFDLEFMENIQILANSGEPFTRSCLAVRSNDTHQMRVLLHSTNRYPSKLEAQLLRDIITLASSLYPDIHKPAQGTLVHCMKQLIGSYSIIIKKAITVLREVIKTRDYMKMQVLLKLLMIKKIHRKLMSDYNNITEITMLLIECCKVNELEISMYADKILSDIVSGMKIPSSTCILDERAYTPLAPPNQFLNLQVEAVKNAKDKKRSRYLSLLIDLQSKLVELLESEKAVGWKLPMLIIRFIVKIQSHLEIEVDPKALETIFKYSQTKHPDMIHLAIKSFLGIFNKIFSLSDYSYDVARAYDSAYDPGFITELDTSQDGFSEKFRREMNNFESPSYFIDSRMFVGWFCWGRFMKVVKANPIEVNLRQNEIEAFQRFGDVVNYEWLQNIVDNLIQDNETHGVFSSGNVSFFVLLIFLISHNFTKLKLENLISLCESRYDRNDKASMIMSTEIFAALICGSKFMYAENLQLRDMFVARFLPSCVDSELNQDAFGIWATLCWWLPTVVDLRRCKPFYLHFSSIQNLLDKKSDDPAHQASKLLMLRSILLSMEYRSPDLSTILNSLVTDHPYDQVREAVAKVLTTLMQSSCCVSLPNEKELVEKEAKCDGGLGSPVMVTSKTIDNFVKKQFQDITQESANIRGLAPQQILKTRYYYLTSTMVYWIKEMIKGSNRILLVPYIINYVAPFLLSLLTHRDVCKLAGLDPTILYVTLSYMPLRKEVLEEVVGLMCYNKDGLSSYQMRLKLGFVQHFFSSQLLQLAPEQRDSILDFVVSHLYNERYVEVRMRASDVLSDIVHNAGENDERLKRLVQLFSGCLGSYKWEEKQKLSKADVKIHGSILGLGAVIQAFPYVFPLPRWIPAQLSNLASWSRTSGVAGTAAKSYISEFKKVRTDTWKFDRLSFTQEELEDLEGVLWSSYYA